MVRTPASLILSSVGDWAKAVPSGEVSTARDSKTTKPRFIVASSVRKDLGQELPRAIGPGRGEERLGIRLFDHLTAIHEDHAMGHPPGEPHLVGDHHHGHAA